MPFPTTRDGLREAGYNLEFTRACQACGKSLDFYRTPKGKLMPIETTSTLPHFANCPKAKHFRKSKKGPA